MSKLFSIFHKFSNRWQSLNAKLLLLFVAMIVILLIVPSILIGVQIEQNLHTRISEELERSVNVQASIVTTWIKDRKDNMVTVAGTARVRTMEPDKIGDSVKQYFDQWKIYEAMFVATPNGKTIYRTDGTTAIDLTDRSYFQQALNHQVVFADPVVSKATGNLVFAVAAPIEVDGKVVGVMGATIPTARIAEVLAKTQLGKTGEAYLINAAGFFITPSRFTTELKRAGTIKERTELEIKVNSLGARQALAGKQGAGEYTDYRGANVLGAYAPIPETNWGLLIEQDSSEAFEILNTLTWMLLAVAGFALIVAGVPTIFFARSVTMPLAAMSKVAMQIAVGDVSQDVKKLGQQERALEQVIRVAVTSANAIGRILEEAIQRGELTEAQIFDTDYRPIPGANPAKFATAYDQFTDRNLQTHLDRILGENANFIYAVAVDTNGYLPTHNSRYSQKLTGHYQQDLNSNRTKRMFNDAPGLSAAQNVQPYLYQLYSRDTGDEMVDVSAPIWVRGKHWGAFRVGYPVTAMDEIHRLVYAFGQMIAYMKQMAAAAETLAHGDLNTRFKPLSKQDTLGNAFALLTTNLRSLVDDTQVLTQAAVEGKLGTRADANKYQGAYRDIVQGVNGTLDAVINPLNVAAEYVDRISKGDIPPKITDSYNGDFNEIKNNLNQCIDEMNGLVDDINALMRAGVQGNLNYRDDVTTNHGAFREIMQGINDLFGAIVTPIEETKSVLAQIAHGNLTIRMNGNFKGDFAVLRDSVEAMVQSLMAMAQQSQQSANSMTSATSQILASSTQMASTTREQASAVTQVTSTVRQIKISAEQVAERAQAVASQAAHAIQVADKGTAAIEETMTGMQDIHAKVEAIAENILALSEQTQQIGEIIDTVTDIAGQSNILALNAAIEAAQAGEAGKGFRVVADEVRNLAEQSRQAASQVKLILGDIQKATNRAVMATEQGTKGVNAGSEQVNRTAQTIQELARAVESSSQAAQDIVAGVDQQTIGLDQIVAGMNDINSAAQQSATGAQQSQQAAQSMNELAEQLRRVVAQYKM
jgi:methyl-accepting chemotaxis protein